MHSTQPFVGRAAELSALTGHLAALAEGRGHVVLLRGPAGIGKTRLVEESVAQVGARVGRGYAVDDAGAPPLWPWRQACAAAGLVEVVPLLEQAPAADGTEAETAASRFRWLADIADAITAHEDPVVLVIEDVHWADRGSLDLLRVVASSVAQAPLAVFATTRPADAEHETQFGLLARFPAVESLEVSPLTVADVALLLGADAAAAPHVHAETRGLPLLLAAGRGQAYDLRGVALSLIAQARDDLRPAIEAAAVLGEQVDEELLTAVLDDPPDLASLARAGLVSEDRTRFIHALIREAVLELVTTERKAEVHRQAADHLILTPGVPAARVAVHLQAAGDARTATWALRAADEAAAALAYDDAFGFLRSVESAQLASGVPAQEIAATRLAMANASYLAGRPVPALELCRQVAAASEDSQLLASAALVVRGMSFPDADQTNVALAVRALEHEQPDSVRSRLLAQLATSQANMGLMAEAVATTGEAWEVAERSGDVEALLAAAQAREITLLDLTDEPERLRVASAAAEYASRLDRPVAGALAQGWRMRAAYALADVGQVGDSIDALTSIAARTGLPLVQWHLARALTARATLEGRLEEARISNDHARTLADAAGDTLGASLSDALELQFALVRGDPAEITRAPAVLESERPIPLAHMMKALTRLVLGDRTGAEASYLQLRGFLEQPEVDLRWGGVLLGLVDLAEAFGDAEAAEELARRLEPALASRGAPGIHTAFFVAPVSAHVGRCLALVGRRDDAELLLRRAVHECVALRARPYAAQTRIALARVLLTAGSAPKAREARGLLREAADEARRLDLRDTLMGAEDLLLLDDDPLSPREREIAGLVVQAMSNREIAERLVISERTVETHVRAVLAKLGCSSRTELIARRSDLGL